jgi:hypothetical protein
MEVDPELARRMEEKGNQELRAMFAAPDAWKPEALDAARSELERRNAALPSPEDVTPEPAAESPPVVLAGVICVQHPTVQATQQCKRCGAFMCSTCDFAFPDGVHLCPACVSRPHDATADPAVESPRVPAGVNCVQHPKVQATQQCKRCGAFMCPTCDFAFPGGIHLCPACVSGTDDSLSPRRKKFLIGAFALALWSTVGMTCLVSGASADLRNLRPTRRCWAGSFCCLFWGRRSRGCA